MAAVNEVVDGRNARRERNVARVLDVVIELFAEDAMFPTMEQVAERSGLSLRSLYRYFADPSELGLAAIERHQQATAEAAHLPAIGEGPLGERIASFCAMRVRVYDQIGPAFRATLANGPRNELMRKTLADRRRAQRRQFELQFAPELAAAPESERDTLAICGDLLTQLDSVHVLRHERGMSARRVEAALCGGLTALLAAD